MFSTKHFIGIVTSLIIKLKGVTNIIYKAVESHKYSKGLLTPGFETSRTIIKIFLLLFVLEWQSIMMKVFSNDFCQCPSIGLYCY